MRRFISIGVLFFVVIAACSSNDESVSVSKQEIANYQMTGVDCLNRYDGGCSCVPNAKQQEQLGKTISTYGDFAKHLAGRESESPEEISLIFEWGDHINNKVPAGLCVPNLDSYRKIGPPTKEFIVERLTALKRMKAQVARSLELLPKIERPTQEGGYLVDKDYQLHELSFSGSMSRLPSISASLEEVPKRIAEFAHLRVVNLSCLNIDEKDITRISKDSLLAYYANGIPYRPQLAIKGEDLEKKHPLFEDYCQSGSLVGGMAHEGDDHIMQLSHNIQSGDIFVVKDRRGRNSWDDSKAAVFIVE